MADDKYRPRGNSLREMNEEEILASIASRQVRGPGRWECVEDDADDTPVLQISPVPPESFWGGRKVEALAAARAYREVAEALEGVQHVLSDAHKYLEELDREEDEGIRDMLSEQVYRLSGILRDGHDSDDMDIEAPSLFRTTFDEIFRLRECDR